MQDTIDDRCYTFLIEGSPLSKANSRRIVRGYNGSLRSIKSERALAYEESALLQFIKQLGKRPPLTGDVGVEINVWYATKRNDLDPSIIFDVMQKAGVYNNDRQIVEMHLFKQWDKSNPRSEVMVYELT